MPRGLFRQRGITAQDVRVNSALFTRSVKFPVVAAVDEGMVSVIGIHHPVILYKCGGKRKDLKRNPAKYRNDLSF